MYDDIPDEQRLFSIGEEISDLYQGVVMLIKDELNALIGKVEHAIESGVDFVVEVFSGAARLQGKIIGAGLRWIIRGSNPTLKSVQKAAFLEPRVVQAYSSRRVLYPGKKGTGFSLDEDESVLYIISENINVSLVDDSDHVIETFSPVTLSIGIDQDKLNELGFGDEQKEMARMYRYDSEVLAWVELAGDSNDHIDTVSTQITHSESYAIGVRVAPGDDRTAPEIVDYYPQDGAEIEPITVFWAKLYESPTGSGIDFAQTMIMIDGTEVDALWNPVRNEISYESLDSLSDGQHTFEVVVTDLNGNVSTMLSTVVVGSGNTSVQLSENQVKFSCYPNPVHDVLFIDIQTGNPAPISVGIYNQFGQRISDMFHHHRPPEGHVLSGGTGWVLIIDLSSQESISCGSNRMVK